MTDIKDKEDENIENFESSDDIETNEENEENKDNLSEQNSQKKEIEDLKDSFKRLQADFINYKNRTNREKVQSIELANESLILRLLPVLDDLERAINSSDNNDDEFYKGICLIKDNLLNQLKEFGLKEVDYSKGFDPNFHHAILSEDSEKEPNEILEVFQKGYILNNKCIRPAMVKVSK